MPAYLIQGHSKDENLAFNYLTQSGVKVRRSLENLGKLSGTFIFIVDAPPGISDKDLLKLPGVKLVEGEFYHPFYTCHPNCQCPSCNCPRCASRISSFFTPPPPPTEAFALAIQLLPPSLYKTLVPQSFLESITGIPTLRAGALSEFDVREFPFGAPGLTLGTPATEEEFKAAGDLDKILEIIRAPQAWKYNQGEGAIVAIIDSGIDKSKVPPSNRLGGFSDAGLDPWTDTLGHGSMVASILLAVAPKVQILSIKPGTSPKEAMSSMGTLTSLDFLAGYSLQEKTPIISNHSWGIWGTKNLVLPCNIFITRAVKLLDHKGLVMTSWAAGNNCELTPGINLYCMNSTPQSTATAALTRDLRPQFYTSRGPGQCYPLQPTVAAPTFGILPWGSGYRNFGEQGGGTSSCAPQTTGALAIMITAYGPRPFMEYRAALRASASNSALGLGSLPYHPLTGSGLLQVDKAVEAVPYARSHPSYLAEQVIPSSIPLLGEEPELAT